jgi:hypothetical protein
MGQNNPYRSTSDNEDNNDHPHTRAVGHSGGNAGAGKSGGEDMGAEKKIDDERFGSRKPSGVKSADDSGKKTLPVGAMPIRCSNDRTDVHGAVNTKKARACHPGFFT